ncbi:hypothetical protein [Erythrobacter sp. F6033]|uniref:hypothetical protein n=1 Tax=Erythrobacter sp. F6033 TaxID=2926401 RepID=UPI001FF62ADE|nr:hypothetical protein [Erythrobacter sp. F6033]MCK0128462.1 hypothetical protein [Erythrobacter sp. F6033]
MMRLAILPALLLLPACSLFDNSDPREGVEEQSVCIERYIDTLNRQNRNLLIQSQDMVVPVFTYDVTKMDLEAMTALMVEGSDQSAGIRLTQQTNELSTAVARFKAEPADEKGAFFLGHDPALYRVRGEAIALDQLLGAACDRQQADMRLVDLEWVASNQTEQTDGADAAPDNETGN